MQVIYLLYTMLLLSAFTAGIRIEIPVGSASLPISISQILCIPLFIHFVFGQRMMQVRPMENRSRLSLLFLFFISSNVLSSLLFSPVLAQSLRSCFNMLGYIVMFLMVRYYTIYFHHEEKAIDKLYWMNILSMVFGLCALILSLLNVSVENIGVSTGHIEGTSSIRALSFEPNLFAMITAVVGMFTFVSLFTKAYKYNSVFVVLLSLASIFFSYTRSVYSSIIISFLILGGILFRRYSANVLKISLAIGILLIVTARFFIAADLQTFLRERIAGVLNFDEGSAQVRLYAYQISYTDIVTHPVLGTGTMSANTGTVDPYTGEFKYVFGGPGWLSGAWMQSLHDTGIVGSIILLSIFIYMIRMNYLAYRDNSDDEIGWYFLAFLGGNIVLAITAQVSSSLSIAFPWIYWGINEAFFYTYGTRTIIETATG
jgi:hypothetical protein